eukprot:GEMP01013403.1.p1 GENE.GEMP01013403.1~~GEMP01013403.1.p1  ORF type:complete len:726 (+),score=238.84 GEMP01013403.1:192-2369(+)
MNDFETALASLAGEDDAFGASTFSAVAYLNKKFPHERSVQQGIDGVLEALLKEEMEVGAALTDSLRDAFACSTTPAINVKDDLSTLTAQLADIERRAKDTHAQVEILSRDIKNLDCAKHNITITVTRLKRFVMLVQALEQLRMHARGRQYKEVANMLLACDHLAGDFVDLAHKVPKIAELFESKSQLLLQLRHQVLEDYDTILSEEKIPPQLRDAAGVVDAMNMRDDILTRFCLRLLEEYKRLFQPPAVAALLAGAEKRFSWLSHKLSEYAKEYRQYFSAQWNGESALCEHFCHMTKQHLVEVLSRQQESDPVLIVKVLRKCIAFENDLAQRYSADVFKGIVSDCFDQFLLPWVQQEEADLLALCRNGKDDILHTTDGEDDGNPEPKNVYTSAAEIFVQMTASLKRCLSFSKRQTLRAVFQSFERVLKTYCTILEERLPKTVTAGGLRKDCAAVIGAVLGTSDYVSSALPKLQELFEEVEWSEDAFSFDEVADLHGDLMSNAVQSFLFFAEVSFKPIFRTWLAQDIGEKADPISQTSEGAIDIGANAHSVFTLVHAEVNTVHFRFFVDKFAQWFVPQFTDAIYRSRNITEVCAQQFLFDTLALKNALVELPTHFGCAPPPPVYESLITSKMEQAEIVFHVLLGDTQNVSHEQLQRISALKADAHAADRGEVTEMEDKAASAPTKTGKQKFLGALDQFAKANQFAKFDKKNWFAALGKSSRANEKS